jgi:3-oxoacyl-[acyl-carrier-protein] synthase III
MQNKAEDRLPADRAVITGWGSFVPAKVLTNEDLSRMVDTSDEWIVTRTGIRTRHMTEDGESTAYLATEAAKRALEYAQYNAADVELIVVATITPEMVFPSTACFVQQTLGAKKAWAFDVAAACSGFVYSLHMVHQLMECGRLNSALVIGAETLTKITNWKDRSSCILFGDGAGAVLLQRKQDAGRGILFSTLGADGDYWESLSCRAYGSRHPASRPLEDPDMIYMQIKGREVYQQAVRRIVEAVTECLTRCSLTLDDVKMFISHQMNARIIESAAKRLNLPDEKVFVNIHNYGNTSAASVPIAFDECVRQGNLKKGDIVILVAFGAGVTWGANVIEI